MTWQHLASDCDRRLSCRKGLPELTRNITSEASDIMTQYLLVIRYVLLLVTTET